MKPIAFLEPEKGPEDLMGIALRRLIPIDDWYEEQLANATSSDHHERIEEARKTDKRDWHTPMLDWWPSINDFAGIAPRSFRGTAGHHYSCYEIYNSRETAVEVWKTRQRKK